MVKNLVSKTGPDYIVFSKDAFKRYVKAAAKGAKVYFLNGDYVPCQIKFAKGAGIDYSLKVMKKHPEWIKECHDKGLGKSTYGQ